MSSAQKRILVAGVGNVLRADDGFGPAVVRALESKAFPADVTTVEMGIAGIELVRHLMDGYDALIIIDAVDRDAAPGTLFHLEPTIPELETLSIHQRRSAGSDMHQTVPERALIVALAAGALPPFVRIIGCQPGEMDEMTMSLTAPVAKAVSGAVDIISTLVAELTDVPTDQNVRSYAG